MNLLLGIDLGTSYFKVGLFDQAGTLKGLGRVAVPKQTPARGRCELPVEDFWQVLRRGLEEALTEAGANAAQIAGLSYSSQANTFVLLDRWDRPLTPLVIWTDERGEAGLEEELQQFSDSAAFGHRTGFQGITGAWAVAKWRWWQKNQPQQWAETRRVMTLSDYFTFSLTGERVGDASTAAFLGLYDLAGRQWWPEALNAFRIDPDLLSDPLPPGTRCGTHEYWCGGSSGTTHRGSLHGRWPGPSCRRPGFGIGPTGRGQYLDRHGSGCDDLGRSGVSEKWLLSRTAL